MPLLHVLRLIFDQPAFALNPQEEVLELCDRILVLLMARTARLVGFGFLTLDLSPQREVVPNGPGAHAEDDACGDDLRPELRRGPYRDNSFVSTEDPTTAMGV